MKYLHVFNKWLTFSHYTLFRTLFIYHLVPACSIKGILLYNSYLNKSFVLGCNYQGRDKHRQLWPVWDDLNYLDGSLYI